MLPKVFASKIQKSQKPAVDVGMALRVYEQEQRSFSLKQKSIEERLIRHGDDISDLKIDVEDVMAEQEAMRQQLEKPGQEIGELTARVTKLEQSSDMRGLMFRLRSVEEAMEDAHTNDLGNEDAIAELKTVLDQRTLETSMLKAQVQQQQHEIAELTRKQATETQAQGDLEDHLEDRLWDVLQRVKFLEQKSELDKGHFKIFPRKS